MCVCVYIWVCVRVYLCLIHVGPHGGWNRCHILWSQVLAIVNHPTGVMWTKLRSSGRIKNTSKLSLQASSLILSKKNKRKTGLLVSGTQSPKVNSSDSCHWPKARNAFGSVLASLEDRDSRRDSDFFISLSPKWAPLTGSYAWEDNQIQYECPFCRQLWDSMPRVYICGSLNENGPP